MKPSNITKIIEQAFIIKNQIPSTPESQFAAFLISWTAWEALRTRFLRVVINKKGWTIKDADWVLARKKISTMKQWNDTFTKELEEISADNWPGRSGKAWKNLKEIEPLRHRLVHGFKSMDPTVVTCSTDVVLFYLKDLSWLEAVELDKVHANQDKIVGSLFDRRKRLPRTEQLPKSELASKLNVELDRGTPKLPTLDELKKILKL